MVRLVEVFLYRVRGPRPLMAGVRLLKTGGIRELFVSRRFSYP